MSGRLIDSLGTTEALSRNFADAALLGAMLEVEVALARAEALSGVIPARAADSIALAAADSTTFDVAQLAEAARASGTLTIPFVQALTMRVAAIDTDSARFVHWGATSQDVWDTALVLCLARAWPAIAADHARLRTALVALATDHADTVMLGRTLLQPATPTTFGLKAAQWLDAVTSAWARADRAARDTRRLQLGGAAGTLAVLGPQGAAVERAVADLLGLAVPDSPWHTNRDRLASLATACGIYVAALGKLATDIALLMQPEVGEVSEPGGGSSTLPHKRNPSASAVVLAAATRVPGLVATMLSSMPHAHERAVGGWHAEAPTLVAIVESTGAAAAAAATALSGLTVDAPRMRANIEATHGVIFAERVTFLVAGRLGKDAAARLVTEAVRETTRSGRSFADIVRATQELASIMTSQDLASLDDPRAYLGSADRLRRQLLARALGDEG